MAKLITLNELYTQFMNKKIDRREFEETLLKILLNNLRKYNVYGWRIDECVDYLSWLYPRISSAIDAYQKSGASFETYMGALVRLSAREYRSRLANKNAAEHAVWVASAEDAYVYGPDSEYPNSGKSRKRKSHPKIEQVKNPRQLLMLLLKCYYHVSDDFLNRLAPRLGIKKEILIELIHEMRELRIQRDEEIRMMKERIHTQFFRCIIYERRLRVITDKSDFYYQLKKRILKARHRLSLMRKRLRRIRLDATNLQIAKILGVSKGTVDSNLHALKEQIKRDESGDKKF